MERRTILDVLIAHDSEITRIGLRALLPESAFRVCGEASSSPETLNKIEQLQPHLLLFQLSLHEKCGLDLVPDFLRLRPGLRILLFASDRLAKDVRRLMPLQTVAKRALQLGALGLLHRADARDFRSALEALRENKTFISPNILETSDDPAPRADFAPSIADLTGREVEVLKHVATGRTTKEIALQLGNSPRTVEAQRANIMNKLGLHSQADLIRFALQSEVAELPVLSRRSSGAADRFS